MKKAKLKEGQKVEVKYDNQTEKGVIKTINENNEIQVYMKRIDIDYWYIPRNVTPLKKTKSLKANIKLFDKVVLPEDMKKKILAVIMQYEESDKLFNKWGLGETIEYGRGMTMLFHGEPGTGKTYTARCIADMLGKEITELNVAEIWSSEPGASERKLKEIFAGAKVEDKILFFDECDSLVTSRGEVGMIIGAEINTLLKEIENFEGVLILATNRVAKLDSALERRISLILEFVEPDFFARKAIWEVMIPKKLPLGEDVNIDKLAEYALTGGLIKNALLNASRFAVAEKEKEVGLKYFEEAIATIIESKGKMGTQVGMRGTISIQRDIEPSVGMDVKRDIVVDRHMKVEKNKGRMSSIWEKLTGKATA